jgi:hypothetical protein
MKTKLKTTIKTIMAEITGAVSGENNIFRGRKIFAKKIP